MDPTTLGPYKIVRKLGEGGMGVVYEAIEEPSAASGGRGRVAVKVLPKSLSTRGGFRARFEIEIKTLRQLDHPNIVRILAFGEEAGLLYYSMELVAGVTLEDALMRGEKFPWKQVVQIGVQTGKALKHAHDRGIVHRDVKPANLMMLPDGQVKLADFGIAQLFGVSGLTVDGGVVGTASFLSPEQADGERASARSDLYSLGATLYALLTGRPPFVANTLPELLRLQRKGTPQPVRLLAPDTPQELEGIVSGLLEKDPDDRIPNAQTLTKSLSAVEAAVDLRLSQAPAAPSPAARTQAGGVDATIASSPSATANVSTPNDATLAAARTPPTPVKSETRAATAAADAGDAPAAPQETGATFMTAAEAAEIDRQRERVRPVTIPVMPILVVLGAIAVASALLYVLLPASADKLYARISAAAMSGDQQRLRAEIGDMREFLRNFRNDPRADDVAKYLDRVQAGAGERPNISVGPAIGSAPETPIQALVRQGRQTGVDWPEKGLAQLEALVALAGDGSDLSEPDKQAVAQAKEQIEILRQRIKLDTAGHLVMLHKRLTKAQELAKTDPVGAKKMAQAIVDLYGDKAWAKEPVDEARKMLMQNGVP